MTGFNQLAVVDACDSTHGRQASSWRAEQWELSSHWAQVPPYLGPLSPFSTSLPLLPGEGPEGEAAAEMLEEWATGHPARLDSEKGGNTRSQSVSAPLQNASLLTWWQDFCSNQRCPLIPACLAGGLLWQWCATQM